MTKPAGTSDDLDLNDVQTLSKASITSESLPKISGKPKNQQQLAIQAGLAEMAMLKWINMGDLSRIKDLAGRYIELFEAAGVDTVKELRACQPEQLTDKLFRVNEVKRIVRKTPTLQQVRAWIAQAKRLEPAPTH